MKIYVNGKELSIGHNATLCDVVAGLNEKIELLAIELNGELVDKSLLGHYHLKENDHIEFIRYMSGG